MSYIKSKYVCNYLDVHLNLQIRLNTVIPLFLTIIRHSQLGFDEMRRTWFAIKNCKGHADLFYNDGIIYTIPTSHQLDVYMVTSKGKQKFLKRV